MPHSETHAPRYDPELRDWGFERRVERLIKKTDFLSLTEPEQMPPEVFRKMLYDFEQNRIEDTPHNRLMFLKTQQLLQELEEIGIIPEQVKPTRDGKGYVRLTFEAVFALLDLIPEEDAHGE